MCYDLGLTGWFMIELIIEFAVVTGFGFCFAFTLSNFMLKAELEKYGVKDGY